MPGYEILIMLAVVVLLVIAALFAVPRVMRTWTAATSPTDERIEYATHMGKAVDQGLLPATRPSASAWAIARSRARPFASSKPNDESA